jgi:uncharacterized protein (DUF488 family)
MTSTLFTIGFTKKTAAEFFDLLQSAGVRKVVDIRENPGGQLSGFAKYPDLAFFLDRILGAAYMREPRLAPSPEIRETYKRTRDWQQYEQSFLTLMKERAVPECIDRAGFEDRVALLCSEAGPEKCHRRLVADLLAAHWSALGDSVEVKHLVMDRPSRRCRRKPGRGRQKAEGRRQ